MLYTNIIILYIVLYNLTNVECYKKYKNYQNVRNYIVFHKYTIVWICDQIKYVIVYKKRHVCVFPPSSGSLEQFWVKGTGVCSCCVTHSFLLPFMPQAHLAWVCLLLWLKISRCQIPGGLEFSPSSVRLLPALPLGERPQPGQAPAQPPLCGVSESCLGLLGSLEVQTGSDRALGKGWWGPACWGSSVAPHLWASCHSGATFPFCPCCPFCILITVGLVAQPCNLMETQLPSPGP